MPDRQIFYDPERKRWKRLRRIFRRWGRAHDPGDHRVYFECCCATRSLPELLLPAPRNITTARCPIASRCCDCITCVPRGARSGRKPSDIPFNSGEGLRAAYYVQDDAASYSSLKEHVHQIDLLFPQWLHVDAPDGTLMMMSSDNLREFPVIEGATVHDPDDRNRVKHVIQAARTDTEIFPHVNNYNPHTQSWDADVGNVLMDPEKSASLREQFIRFLSAQSGVSGPFARYREPLRQRRSAHIWRLSRRCMRKCMRRT